MSWLGTCKVWRNNTTCWSNRVANLTSVSGPTKVCVCITRRLVYLLRDDRKIVTWDLTNTQMTLFSWCFKSTWLRLFQRGRSPLLHSSCNSSYVLLARLMTSLGCITSIRCSLGIKTQQELLLRLLFKRWRGSCHNFFLLT